jgi:hypothetical protein
MVLVCTQQLSLVRLSIKLTSVLVGDILVAGAVPLVVLLRLTRDELKYHRIDREDVLHLRKDIKNTILDQRGCSSRNPPAGIKETDSMPEQDHHLSTMMK